MNDTLTNQTQTIALSDVKISRRMREDLGDVASLAQSISILGLVQPIVLNRDNSLVAGERRYRAHQHLGLERIKFVYTDQIVDEGVKAEMEFEENFRRKAFSWQEECLGILDIYRKKRSKGALEGWQFGVKQCGEMFGMALGRVDYVIKVARKLEAEKSLPDEQRRYWKFQSCNEAYRLGLMAEAEDAATAELARRAKLAAETASLSQVVSLEKELSISTGKSQIEIAKELEELRHAPENVSEDAFATEMRRLYDANPLNKDAETFEGYLARKKEIVQKSNERKNTVCISNIFHNIDCIDYMMDNINEGRFNHIITDIPYAIDTNNLQQQGGGVDVDRTKAAHQIDENIELIRKFFPAAFKCTNDKAFVITFCDLTGDPDTNTSHADCTTLWELLVKHALLAGFAVQRWPMFWRKVGQSVGNNCAAYNTTKDYESILVCRKPGATVFNKLNTSFLDGSNNEAVKLTGHPFAKPFEVTRKLIEMVSMESQLILEPFMGGGSMALEILRSNRNVVGVEKEKHHFDGAMETLKREYYLKLNPKFIFR